MRLRTTARVIARRLVLGLHDPRVDEHRERVLGLSGLGDAADIVCVVPGHENFLGGGAIAENLRPASRVLQACRLPRVVQQHASRYALRHTVRGLHFQTTPHAQTKIVGVARDTPSYIGEKQPQPVLYITFPQRPAHVQSSNAGTRIQMSFMLRTAGDPLGAIPAVRRAASLLRKAASCSRNSLLTENGSRSLASMTATSTSM